MSSWNCHIVATCNEKQRQDQSKAFYQFDFFDLILNSTYNDNYSDFLGLKLFNFLILLHTHPILPCLAQYLLATNFALQNRILLSKTKDIKRGFFSLIYILFLSHWKPFTSSNKKPWICFLALVHKVNLNLH